MYYYIIEMIDREIVSLDKKCVFVQWDPNKVFCQDDCRELLAVIPIEQIRMITRVEV